MDLTHAARLLFIGLITHADDDGRGSADPRKLKSCIFPGDEVTLDQVREWLREIEAQRLAVVYAAREHGPLFCLPTWHEHQNINRPTASRYPPPDPGAIPDRYVSTHGALTESSVSAHGAITGDRKDRIGRKGSEGAPGARPAPQARAPGALEQRDGPTPEAAAAAAEANKRNLRRLGLQP